MSLSERHGQVASLEIPNARPVRKSRFSYRLTLVQLIRASSRLVVATTEDPASDSVICQRSDEILVPFQNLQAFSGIWIPDPDTLIVRARHEDFAVVSAKLSQRCLLGPQVATYWMHARPRE